MASIQPSGGQHGTGPRPKAPDGTRLYAVGDIHGRADLLERIHRQIRADADEGENASRKIVRKIIYLGDYIDRGPQSFEVVDMLISDPLPGFEAVHLKGNHEDFLLGFLEDGRLGESWLMNGGFQTIISYGVDCESAFEAITVMKSVRESLTMALPENHKAFFAGLKTYHIEGDYLFVHAGLKPGRPLKDQDEHSLLWIRGEFLGHAADFGKMVVHGHSIQPEPDIRPNRVGIDTGAYYSNRLTCMVIEGQSARFIHT